MTKIETNQEIVAVFDLDRTLSKKDTYLAFLFLALKARPHRFFYTLHLPFSVLVFYLGIRDNAWLKSVFLKAIAGSATRSQVAAWSSELVDRLQKNGLRKQALEQLEYHREAGHRTILLTASFDFYVHCLAERLKFDHVICSDAAWTNSGLLAGGFVSENCHGAVKLNKLKNYLTGKRRDWHIIAFSDHHSDLPLLEWADYSVAVNPTRPLREIALQKNIKIQNWN